MEEISKARMLHVRQNGKKKRKSNNNVDQDDKQGIDHDNTAVTKQSNYQLIHHIRIQGGALELLMSGRKHTIM